MVQLGGGAGFTLEAFHGGIGQSQAGRQHLQGNATIEGDLPSLVDDAHAAAAQFSKQLEVTEACQLRIVGRGLVRLHGSALRVTLGGV